MQAAFIADASQRSMHDLSFEKGAVSVIAGLLEGDPFQALAGFASLRDIVVIREGEAVFRPVALGPPARVAQAFQRWRRVVWAKLLVLLRNRSHDCAVIAADFDRGGGGGGIGEFGGGAGPDQHGRSAHYEKVRNTHQFLIRDPLLSDGLDEDSRALMAG